MEAQKTSYYRRIEKIMKNISNQDLGKFSKLKSDQERFKFLFQNAEVQKEIAGYVLNPNEVEDIQKSDKRAREFREMGNKCYKAGDVNNALRFYNLAVLKAEIGEDYGGFCDSVEGCCDGVECCGGSCGGGYGKDPCKSESKTQAKNTTPSELSFCLANRSACLIYLQQKQQKHQLQPLYQPQQQSKMFQQQHYDYLKDSIKDIRDSMTHGYPEAQKYKLVERKIKCLKLMEEEGKRMLPKTLNEFVECLKVAGLEEKDKCELMEKAKRDPDYNNATTCATNDATNTATTETTENDDTSTATTVTTTSPSTQTPISLISIAYTPDKGNHVVLNETFKSENSKSKNAKAELLKSGSIVMKDKTYFRVLDEEYLDKRCYSCLKNTNLSTHPIIPCIGCSKVVFCSYKCREFGMEVLGHSLECKVLSDLIASQTGCIIRLALCVLLNVRLERWLEIIDGDGNNKTDIEKINMNDINISSTINTSSDHHKAIIYNDAISINQLLTHSNKRSSMELFQYCLLSVYLVSLLRKKTELFGGLGGVGEKEEKSLVLMSDMKRLDGDPRILKCGGIILKLLQIIACNAIEITETSKKNPNSTSNPKQTIFNLETTKTGLALYPGASLFNHSCFPDVEFIFHQDSITAVTLKPVKPGEELCADYGVLFHLTPREERLSQLRGHYFFDCKCLACYKNWPVKNLLQLKAVEKDLEVEERNRKVVENSQKVLNETFTNDFAGQNDGIALERAMLGGGKDFIGNLSSIVASNVAGMGGLPDDDKDFDKLMKKALKDLDNLNKNNNNIQSISSNNNSNNNPNSTNSSTTTNNTNTPSNSNNNASNNTNNTNKLQVLSIEEAIEKANRMDVTQPVMYALER